MNSRPPRSSFLSGKVKPRESSIHGKGLFAIENILKHEVIIDYSTGPGQYVDHKQADALYEQGIDYMIQIDEDLFFAATNGHEIEAADYLNHSCDPTCCIRGSLEIVAMRDIQPGEEITTDYAMIDVDSAFHMFCNCGSQRCRGVVTGEDWKLPELKIRYKGCFSGYIRKKLEILS